MHQMKKTNQSSKASKIGKPRGKPFEAGNTIGKGRPKGSLNKTTVALRELFSRDAVAIGEKVLTMAKEGDPMALRVVMDRIFPARRGAPAPWNMPAIKTSADLTAANLSLLEAAAKGELTPAEAHEYIPLLDSVHRVLDRDASMKWDHESAASLRFLMGYNDDVTLERTEERRRELLLKMVYAQVETRLAAQMKAQSREHSDSTPRPAPAKPSESAPLKPTTTSVPPAAAVQRTGQRRRDHSAPTNAAASSEASKPANLSDPSVELRQKQEAPQKDGTKEPHLQSEADATDVAKATEMESLREVARVRWEQSSAIRTQSRRDWKSGSASWRD